MNLPENQNDNCNDKFCALAEDFNKSAAAFASGSGLSFDGLMTKFNILWRFKAETPQEHMRLTQSLFDGGISILRRISEQANKENLAAPTNNLTQIFEFLMKPEQKQFLPDNASEQLVDAALALIKKSEGVVYEYNWKDYAQHKEQLITLAKSLATYAEKTSEPKPAIASFAAGKTIPPAKRPALSSESVG